MDSSLREISFEAQTSSAIHDHSKIVGFRKLKRSHWALREDVRRVLLFEIQEDTRETTKVGLMHPSEAVIMALFNGRRTVAEVEMEVAYLFDLDAEKACKTVGSILNRRKEALDDNSTGDCPVYDPMDFVIPEHCIDVTSKKLYKPLGLIFHVSDDCMRNCIYCNVQKRKTRDLNLLQLSRWEELAAEAVSLGVFSITLSGGDPFMRKDIFEILGYFYRRGLPAVAATKSYISERMAGQLAEIGMKYLQISIDAPTADLADFLTGSKGFYRQAIASICNLIKQGIQVRTNSVITRFNVRQVPQLVHLLSDLGVDPIRLSAFARSL